MKALWKRLLRRQVRHREPRFTGRLAQVTDGRLIVVSEAGRPVARALPPPPQPQVRRPGRGSLRGRIHIPADFDHASGSVVEALGMR